MALPMLIAALLVPVAAAQPHPASMVGFYQIRTMEVGGGLQLQKNGHFRYELEPKELHLLQADDNGDLHPEDCAVTMIMPLVPMYRVPGEPIKLSPTSGHRLSLRFQPNDLGRPAFDGEPLKINGSSLLMER